MRKAGIARFASSFVDSWRNSNIADRAVLASRAKIAIHWFLLLLGAAIIVLSVRLEAAQLRLLLIILGLLIMQWTMMWWMSKATTYIVRKEKQQ